ncbi:ABC transporter ATP-binding protein [Paramuribaculum intestinale]|uniref:ABC transporter ATP-binding protein n=1 Tax=Paramuribaculum intestinale TaxID=2094151 RepID=UPI0025A58B1A|nr:ABC transporter ATP-binding protein [Paramuribaculum intestinale]
MLEIKDITFSYGRHRPPVLNDFSANIRDGGIYGLLGRNGAGKSTLLYLAAGLLTPQSGHVYYNGTDTRLRRPSTLSDIFIVPEEFSLPNIRLGEFLRLNSRFYPNFSLDDMRRHLDTFELESDLHLGSLSMGQKKKAFMCFALACNTSLLLLDESRFRKFIVSSMTDDRTILISTHQVRDIDRILDHVVITERSRVLLDRSTAEITERLRFVNSDSPALMQQALFAQPAVGGSALILPNDNPDQQTELNLESLFEYALNNPESLTSRFTQQ